MNKKPIIAAILVIIASYAGLRKPGEQPAPANRPQTQIGTARSHSSNISVLTQQRRVADYLQQHHQLPGYYLGKAEARRQGWDPAKGNLCSVLPGKAIGGDRFSNREGGLPDRAGRRWFEADVNYQCGRRGTDRMLYSSDGLIFVTNDHYRHFERVN
ncbi:ribonuclease domain-containing protein [Erwinia pyrifoliae]|uniref:Ribonuclease n=1 Tax=Erwinia pyrifoliae TaxID=79967 RepID=A0ABY5XCR4_ERWPY|nr:ribonuclease domain-containing protein [Erwinia pyrifoliae]AUX72709.1 ribonuclease [Erwinia pyrifoliae]MCA8877028.1 ribonuclease [Erwinia pyrifoliae]MCT2387180.1 ribonuclease [Erwinia pyrifoliae]MCU8587220.1 ribonuclease [Erwinia pyrifoliae]UWS31081.1 ribonuclease [Erwinia pyrifoliae]